MKGEKGHTTIVPLDPMWKHKKRLIDDGEEAALMALKEGLCDGPDGGQSVLFGSGSPLLDVLREGAWRRERPRWHRNSLLGSRCSSCSMTTPLLVSYRIQLNPDRPTCSI
jgi:hypothetical protein